jgi:hypothetical protein
LGRGLPQCSIAIHVRRQPTLHPGIGVGIEPALSPSMRALVNTLWRLPGRRRFASVVEFQVDAAQEYWRVHE